MNEEELNINYIREKTGLVENDELVPIILEMIKDSYKAGLCQSEFDNTMGLIEENQELKKQLEEWNHHLKCSKEMLDIQGHNGNYNYDSYMLGIYNGMEYIIALFETREPIFKSGKDIEFISDKTQQKEFIEYLKNEIKRLEENDIYEPLQRMALETHKHNLSKFKEIIGKDINVTTKGDKDDK